MKHDLINKRLSKTRRVGKILAILPFVRCVILNGSLASGNHKKSSDIDILIIAENGRIFSARFFVIMLASILRIKRSKEESRSHAGKFCFNYFLTENYLKIPTGRGERMDQYCAENYSKNKFIAGDRGLFNRYMEANQSLFDSFNCHFKYLNLSSPRRRGSRKTDARVILNLFQDPRFRISSLQSGMTRCCDRYERLVKNYQIKKIQSDPRTKKYPELIVYNDRELRFHPPKSKG